MECQVTSFNLMHRSDFVNVLVDQGIKKPKILRRTVGHVDAHLENYASTHKTSWMFDIVTLVA